MLFPDEWQYGIDPPEDINLDGKDLTLDIDAMIDPLWTRINCFQSDDTLDRDHALAQLSAGHHLTTIMAHGGEILVAGPGSEAVEGNPEPVSVVVKFPSKEAARVWYDSPEYQAIIHHRLDNTEGSMVFADEFKMPG